MTDKRISVGKCGENIAIDFLKKNGYRILENNFRCRFGEIDIIAMEGKNISFVEVKTRTDNRFGSPKSAVDFRKQRKLSKMALLYLTQKRLIDYPARFDVVSIRKIDRQTDIELVKNAFELCW
jgi:putative endonuclease